MKALLKPIVWVCLFFFAYQSTYAQALKIMSYNCRMSGEMTGYSVKEYAVFIRKYNPDVVMLQEIDYNTKRNKKQDFTTQLENMEWPYFQNILSFISITKLLKE